MVRTSTRTKKPVIETVSKPKKPRVTNKKVESPIIKIVSHHLYNIHYTAYTVCRANGKVCEVTEYDMKNYADLLDKYREELTGLPNGEGDYEVERIVAHRYVPKAGKLVPLYLIQWKGYEDPVWYSEMWEEELTKNRNLLEVYEKNPCETR